MSWIRLSDLNLLAVGRYTYTTDLRWEGIHQKFSPDWKLVLNDARISDSGTYSCLFLIDCDCTLGVYECQISSTPHMSKIIRLTVRGTEFILSLLVLNRNIFRTGDRVAWQS